MADALPDWAKDEPAALPDWAKDDAPATTEKPMTGLAGMAAKQNPATGDILNGKSSIVGNILSIPDKAGSAVAETTAGWGLHPDAAAALGVGANLGINAIPIMRGGKAAEAAAPIMRKGAEWMMQSALKPIKEDLLNGNAAKAIDTMLDEGVSVSTGGMVKLQNKIDEWYLQVKDALSKSTANVKISEVTKPLDDLVKKFKTSIAHQDDIKSAKDIWQQFKSELGGATEIPVQKAQELKQGTYKRIADTYEHETNSAAQKTRQALASGMKQEIEKQVPEVVIPNEEMSKLINAMNVAEARTLLELNKNPMALSLLADNPVRVAAMLADKSSHFKSALARMLNAGKVKIPTTAVRAGIAGSEGVNQAVQSRNP